jgi:hypothetical protein
VLLGNFGSFGDGSGDISTLGDADTDFLAVTDDDERAETETAAAFDDTGDAVDVQRALIKLLFFWSLLRTAATAVIATTASTSALAWTLWRRWAVAAVAVVCFVQPY